MAKQDPNPPTWNDSMSDGCSAPFFLKPLLWRCKKDCLEHDEAYHVGGTWEDKLRADDKLWVGVAKNAIFGEWTANRMYNTIRTFTYNFPPGHPNRSSRNLTKVKAWNWLGTGPQRET